MASCYTPRGSGGYPPPLTRNGVDALRNEIDLDPCTLGQTRHADAGPGRAPTDRKITGVDGIHRRVVLIKVRQVDTHLEYVL